MAGWGHRLAWVFVLAGHCKTLGGLRIGKNDASPRWLQSPQRRLGLLQPPCEASSLLDLAYARVLQRPARCFRVTDDESWFASPIDV